LVVEHYKSISYKHLDHRTQHVTKLIIDKMLLEPIAPNRLRRLRRLFQWALETGIAGIETNPARDVPPLRPLRLGGFPAWTPEHIERFEKHYRVGSKPRLALALLLYTGARRSDVVQLGREHVRNGTLIFRQHKGRNRSPLTLELPVLPVLQEIIDASPTGDLTFLATDYGKPFTAAGFGNWFRLRCNDAGLKGLSAHGLRKAGATRAAENGASAHQLMAIFGWRAIRHAEGYTRGAERKRLARDAMHLLAGTNEGQMIPTTKAQRPKVRKSEAKK
jgi:integrase